MGASLLSCGLGQGGKVPYRNCGLVAPQRGHGAGRGGPRGQLGGAGERRLGAQGRRAGAGERGLGDRGWRGLGGSTAGWGRRALGRRGAGAEAQSSVAEAVQEAAGVGDEPALGEPPPGPSQLRPHAAQHVQRAPVLAQAGARRGAGLGAAGLQLFLHGRGCFLILVLLLLLLLRLLLGSGLRIFNCSRHGFQPLLGASQQEPGGRGGGCPWSIALNWAGSPDDSLRPEECPPLQAEVVLRKQGRGGSARQTRVWGHTRTSWPAGNLFSHRLPRPRRLLILSPRHSSQATLTLGFS